MNLVFVTPSIKTGGGNRVFIELANHLCEKHDVKILFPNNSSEACTYSADSRVKFVRVGKVTDNKVRKFWNLLKCIHVLNRNYRKDLLVISDPLFCIFSFGLRAKNIVRYVQADDYRIFDDGMILGRGFIFKVYKMLCLRSFKLKNIHFLFVSRFVYDQYTKFSGRRDVPCHIVNPSIDKAFYCTNEQRNQDGKKVSICMVARKHPLKGLITFIQAYRNLPKEIVASIDKIYLMSQDDLSAFDTRNMQVIKPDSDDMIRDIYNLSDIFISASWYEGCPLPPMEAMACGCAVITSDSGGVKEYAKPEENCLMFEPKNEVQLQNQLCRLITDRELRIRIAKNGLKTASQFSWKKSSEQFQALIERY